MRVAIVRRRSARSRRRPGRRAARRLRSASSRTTGESSRAPAVEHAPPPRPASTVLCGAAGGRGRAHRQPADLRVRILRRGAQHAVVHGRRADQRFERQAPHARAGGRLAAPGRRETAQHGDRVSAGRTHLAMKAHQRLESLRDAEPVGDRFGARRHLEQRSLRRLDLRRGCYTAGGRSSRRSPRERPSPLRLSAARRAGRRRRRARTPAAALSRFPALRGLTDRVRGLRAHFRERMPQRRRDVGDERRALEAAERANGDAHRLTVAAARAGLDDRRGRAPSARGGPRPGERRAASRWSARATLRRTENRRARKDTQRKAFSAISAISRG